MRWQMGTQVAWVIGIVTTQTLFVCPLRADESLARATHTGIFESCLDCHSESTGEGGFEIPSDNIDWSDESVVRQYEMAYQVVTKRVMPPDAATLDDGERTKLVRWLDQKLMEHSPVGGTPLRRLSRREYANTIREVFGLTNFELPHSFPPDIEQHGFDNQASALVISGSHLEALAETAALVADELFSSNRPTVPSHTYRIDADDLVISYSSAKLVDGAMRLASSGANLVRNGTWPAQFLAPENGRYKIEVVASAFGAAASEFPVLQVNAMELPRNENQLLAKVTLDSTESSTYQFEADLDRDQTIVLRYPNGPFSYDESNALRSSLQQIFVDQPELAAAWEKVGDPPRGGNGWERLKTVMADPEFSDGNNSLGPERLDALIKRMSKKNVNTGETLVYKLFEQGPGIAIQQILIHGPIEQYPDRDDVRVKRQRNNFMGPLPDRADTESIRKFLSQLLNQTFRREPTQQETDAYLQLVNTELDATGDLRQALHLAVRSVLISPAFLYRSLEVGQLSANGLADRLSYFLTSGPPDDRLRQLSKRGDLLNSAVLKAESQRILNDRFVSDFTTGWLGLDVVQNLMPDKSLVRKFTNDHRRGMIDEVETTFSHVLTNNRSISELIHADYVFTSQLLADDIYGIEWPDTDGPKKRRKPKSANRDLERIPVPVDSVRGGLLTMPAIMMATANGVDTQPVLRGVWFLDNVLGSPLPDPPDAVPALTPDTRGATTPKEQLAAHTNEESCAVCHREIDAFGFVFEHFDAIGRWREVYPVRNAGDRKSNRASKVPVETDGVLPDGTSFTDIRDLKTWLAAHPERFANCLAEKLMTYATGRTLSHREKAMVADIVGDHAEDQYPLSDVLMDLIDSPIFRTK